MVIITYTFCTVLWEYVNHWWLTCDNHHWLTHSYTNIMLNNRGNKCQVGIVFGVLVLFFFIWVLNQMVFWDCLNQIADILYGFSMTGLNNNMKNGSLSITHMWSFLLTAYIHVSQFIQYKRALNWVLCILLFCFAWFYESDKNFIYFYLFLANSCYCTKRNNYCYINANHKISLTISYFSFYLFNC